MVSRYGEAAKLEGAMRAEELAADGDLAGVAVGLRIIDATGQLAITTPSGPVHWAAVWAHVPAYRVIRPTSLQGGASESLAGFAMCPQGLV